MTQPTNVTIAPVPTDEEAAAIVAAIELASPHMTESVAATAEDEPSRWRFSGRWWTKPVPSRRDRP